MLVGSGVGVIVRLDRSRVTDWRSNNFSYTYMENGTLQIKTIYKLHFRADIRKYRKVIHFPPVEPSGGIFSAKDSAATFSGSGSGPGIGGTYQLKGSGILSNSPMPGSVNNAFAMVAAFSNTGTQMTAGIVADSVFGLGGQTKAGCTCTFCAGSACGPPAPIPVFGPNNSAGPSGFVPFFTFTLDDSATIQSRSDSFIIFSFCNQNLSVGTGNFKRGPAQAAEEA